MDDHDHEADALPQAAPPQPFGDYLRFHGCVVRSGDAPRVATTGDMARSLLQSSAMNACDITKLLIDAGQYAKAEEFIALVQRSLTALQETAEGRVQA